MKAYQFPPRCSGVLKATTKTPPGLRIRKASEKALPIGDQSSTTPFSLVFTRWWMTIEHLAASNSSFSKPKCGFNQCFWYNFNLNPEDRPSWSQISRQIHLLIILPRTYPALSDWNQYTWHISGRFWEVQRCSCRFRFRNRPNWFVHIQLGSFFG